MSLGNVEDLMEITCQWRSRFSQKLKTLQQLPPAKLTPSSATASVGEYVGAEANTWQPAPPAVPPPPTQPPPTHPALPMQPAPPAQSAPPAGSPPVKAISMAYTLMKDLSAGTTFEITPAALVDPAEAEITQPDDPGYAVVPAPMPLALHSSVDNNLGIVPPPLRGNAFDEVPNLLLLYP